MTSTYSAKKIIAMSSSVKKTNVYIRWMIVGFLSFEMIYIHVNMYMSSKIFNQQTDYTRGGENDNLGV